MGIPRVAVACAIVIEGSEEGNSTSPACAHAQITLIVSLTSSEEEVEKKVVLRVWRFVSECTVGTV